MMGLSIPHLLIFMLVVILLFGRGRITALMTDLGGGFRQLKKGLSDAEDVKHELRHDL